MFTKNRLSTKKFTQQWPLKTLSLGLLSALFISGCGGGGSSDGGTDSVTYTGSTQAAELDNQNTPAFASQTFTGMNSADTSNFIGAQDIGTSNASKSITNTLLSQTRLLSRSVNNDKRSFSSPAGAKSAVIDISVNAPCPNGGSVVFTGSIDDVTQTGSLSLTYNNCLTEDARLSGSASLNIDAYNAEIDEHTDVELIFNNLRIEGLDPTDNIDFQVGANIRAQKFYTAMLDPYTERASIDMTLANNNSGASIKIENYLVEVIYDRYSVPTSATADISGRLYHHTYGYVDVDTINPLQYSSAAINTVDLELIGFPDAGGPLIYTGARNKKIRLTPVDAISVNVAADTDGDDIYEYSITVPWNSLEDEYINNSNPVANAGANASISLGQTAQLDGGQSTDADFNLIDFSWAVINQPLNSNPGLVGGAGINPALTPDMAGDYTLELTVNDGWFTNTDTVVITVTP